MLEIVVSSHNRASVKRHLVKAAISKTFTMLGQMLF